jgi:dephospho-CoA kinase
MLKFAITGNIASGKSTVEKIIEANGFKVYDTDKIAHDILDNSVEVKNVFATTDRKELAKIVFNNPEKLKQLEAIIHPKVKKVLEDIFTEEDKIVFVSVPQLYESGFEKMFDKVIFVSAKESIRLERLMNRNGISKEDAEIRIKAQDVEDYKIKKADFVIINNGNLDELKTQVLEILDFNIC